MPPLVIAGAVAAAGAVGGAAIASHGASSAANAQANAANSAAQLQHQDAQSALNFQQGQYGNQQSELAPYANVGYSGLANLANLLGILPPGSTAKPVSSAVTGTAGQNGLALSTGGTNGGAGTPGSYGINVPSNLQNLINPSLGASGSLLKPFNGVVSEQNDPGYQFRLNQGNQQINNSAAARGELLSGNTLQALNQFGQDYASNEYQNTYNRYNNDQTNIYNRLAAMAGLGQTATNALGQSGQNAANNISNTLLTSGQQIGQNINNAGAARASGYAANGNILGSTIGGLGSNISNLLMLKQLTMPTTSGDQAAFNSGYYGG